jgi:hypothetical protein
MNRKQYAMERKFLKQKEEHFPKRYNIDEELERMKKELERSRDFTEKDVVFLVTYARDNNGNVPANYAYEFRYQKECLKFVKEIFRGTHMGYFVKTDYDLLLNESIKEFRYRNSKLVKALK